MSAILALIQSKTQFNEIFRAALALQAQANVDVIVCFDGMGGDQVSELTVRCEAEDVKYLSIETIFPSNLPLEKRPIDQQCTRRSARIVRWLAIQFLRSNFHVFGLSLPFNPVSCAAKFLLDYPRGSLEYAVRNFLQCWDDDHLQIIRARTLLDLTKVSIILVGEDGLGGNLAIIAVAKRARTTIITIPYEYSSRKQILEAMKPCIEQFRIRTGFDKFVSFLFPRWVRRVSGIRLLRLPAVLVLSRQAHGLAPINPWSVHGGQGDILAAESKRMMEHYLHEGVPRRKIKYVGALAGDDLWRELCKCTKYMRAFESQQKIENEVTNILVAFPPSYVRERSRECEFGSYEALVDFWVKAVLRQKRVRCIFQLHPAIRGSDTAYIESKIAIATEDIAQLIPRCDVLITSVSSIIRFAISCRKPVINYDVYQFDYPDYKNLPGVIVTTNKQEFVEQVGRICNDDVFYHRTAVAQRESSGEWGEIDGRASSRLASIVNEALIARN